MTTIRAWSHVVQHQCGQPVSTFPTTKLDGRVPYTAPKEGKSKFTSLVNAALRSARDFITYIYRRISQVREYPKFVT